MMKLFATCPAKRKVDVQYMKSLSDNLMLQCVLNGTFHVLILCNRKICWSTRPNVIVFNDSNALVLLQTCKFYF